jgi:prefoldin subunit 5
MEVRIGIKDNARDLSFDSALSSTEINDLVQKAFESGQSLVTMSDDKGKTMLIPVASIAYVEIGVEETRRVGFIA